MKRWVSVGCRLLLCFESTAVKDLKDLVPTSVVLVKGCVERVMVYSIGKDDQNKKLKDSSW